MFRYLLSILSLLCMIVSPAVADLASVSHVNTMRDNVQVNIDKKANKANYAQNMVLQTDNSGNVIATTVGTDLFADNSIETMHLADGAVTNADLAGMIDITKLNLGTLPTSGKHVMIWNAETQKYVFERYAEGIVLPAEYTRLEYIESTGTQYIDTGIIPSINTKIVSEFSLYTTINSQKELFGSGIQGNYDATFTYSPKGDSYINYNNKYTDSNLSYGDVHKVIFNDNKKIYIDGELKFTSNANSLSVSNTNIYLFTNGQTNVITSHAISAMMYSLCIYEGSSLVRNFIPVKRNSDGVIGMYDTVSETLFTNAGTGNFIAGPEV